MLGLGRALGETIAVYLIISPVFTIQPHILQTGANSVSALIALRYGEASPFGISALMAAGLALFLLTLVVNFARLDRRRPVAVRGAERADERRRPSTPRRRRRRTATRRPPAARRARRRIELAGARRGTLAARATSRRAPARVAGRRRSRWPRCCSARFTPFRARSASSSSRTCSSSRFYAVLVALRRVRPRGRATASSTVVRPQRSRSCCCSALVVVVVFTLRAGHRGAAPPQLLHPGHERDRPARPARRRRHPHAIVGTLDG